jgi:SAM-dependent methyltransferase
VVDRQFSDAGLAALYDLFCPWGEDFDFYLPQVMAAESVLDVGCGTGLLLHGARQAGHTGRLCGLDPAAGMLEQARKRPGIEWIEGDLSSVAFEGEFDLVVMTGHAFQVLVGDDELRVALAAVRTALREQGRFAFETRNPLARAWERWTPAHAVEATDASGAVVRMAHEVDEPVDGETVSFTTTFTSRSWERAEVSRSTLRFLGTASLASFLSSAGFVVQEQFGDWDRRPLTATSPEIISIVRPA